MLQTPARRSFLKIVGAGLASIGLQRLNGQSKPDITASEKAIPSKSFIDFLKKYGDENFWLHHHSRDGARWTSGFSEKTDKRV